MEYFQFKDSEFLFETRSGRPYISGRIISNKEKYKYDDAFCFGVDSLYRKQILLIEPSYIVL